MQGRVFEVEVLPGLEPYAVEEVQRVRGVRALDGLRFTYTGRDPQVLKRLRSVVAVYEVAAFGVPRPKALLGHAQLTRLVGFVRSIASQDAYASFRFSAAGRESDVFARLAEELTQATGLRYDAEEGELLLRFVRSDDGWDVLARLTPRPLSARAWRVCNMAGGLNATLAHAMLRMGGVRETDRVFNPMCGSGTLLIERAMLGPAQLLAGADVSEDALRCARENVAASKKTQIELARLDVVSDTLPQRAADLIVADLPWGDAVGSHEENARLYPAFLKAMGGVASKHARMVVLTHEVQLFEEVMEREPRWRVREVVRAYHGGHYPRMYLLTR